MKPRVLPPPAAGAAEPLVAGMSRPLTLVLPVAGIAAAALILLDAGLAAPLSQILAAAAFVYAGSAALRSPHVAWPLFVVTCLVITVTRVVGGNAAATWGLLLLAVGLLLHSAWDLLHLLRRRVAPGSMAVFCMALDATLGVAVLVSLGLA